MTLYQSSVSYTPVLTSKLFKIRVRSRSSLHVNMLKLLTGKFHMKDDAATPQSIKSPILNIKNLGIIALEPKKFK